MNLEPTHTYASRRMRYEPRFFLVVLNRSQNRLAYDLHVPAKLDERRRLLRLGSLAQLLQRRLRRVIASQEVIPKVANVAENHLLNWRLI